MLWSATYTMAEVVKNAVGMEHKNVTEGSLTHIDM